MKSKNSWHYARPELAKKYLKYFALGLTSARALFARRRMGKTEFLKQDLIPLAKKAGFDVVYINLWEQEKDPQTAIVSEIYDVLEPKGWEKALSKLKPPVTKVKASAKLPFLIEGSLEAELKSSPRLVNMLLSSALKQFDETKRTMFLIIDEAQVLAYEENTHFAHALRATLDVRKETIKVIFAGSSENTLRRMFGVPSEPFYNWAPLEPFQLLDEDFVKFTVDRVNSISTHPLSLKDALNAFSELKNTPEFFRRYVEFYVMSPEEGSHYALEETKQTVYSDKGFQQQWSSLLPTDQAVLTILSKGKNDLYRHATLGEIANVLGLKEIEKGSVQNAVKRLLKKNLITKLEQGVYRFEDEGFADWIKHDPQ